MGAPTINAATAPAQQKQQQEKLAKLLKDLNDLSSKNIVALTKLSGELAPSSAQVIQAGLQAGLNRTNILINILKMEDSVKAFNAQMAKDNRLMAAKSAADITKAVIEISQKTIKANIDVAMVIAQRQEMTGAISQLKTVSEKLGHLGRAASTVGAISGTIALIDAVRRGDTGAGIKAGAEIAEGLGNAIGGAAPLGTALAAPFKMVLVFGQVGGQLRAIRNQAIRDKTLLIIKKGDRLLVKAKVADAYRSLYFQALADGVVGDDIHYRKALMHDWGRQVGELMVDLNRSMADMERDLANMRGREFRTVFDGQLQQRIQQAADPLGNDRRRHGLVILSGAEVMQNWQLVQQMLMPRPNS
ncbi:MAG: hypothetical protein HC808_08040 [Candidatus Competibacteraceae bacterium]|nr:hypothetical protein [Candidatus Competibacteraceae bacterium]